MNASTLAELANGLLYASMAVFMVAMLVFVWYLAALAPAAVDRQPAVSRKPALVGAGADDGPEVDHPVDVAADDSPRATRLGGIGLSLTWLATGLLTMAVLLRGIAVARPPWGNMFEFACAGACAAALIYSVLAKRNRWHWMGAFVVTPVLLTLGLAVMAFYVEATELLPVLKSVWLGIHVTVAVLATGVWILGFSTGVLYLLKARRDAAAVTATSPLRRSFLDGLPTATRLERTTYGLNMAGFILYTFTLVAGAIWAQKAWGSYWNWDPKEVATFVVWSVYAAYMHARATAGWDPRRATYIAMAGFVALTLNFTVVNLFIKGAHSYSGL